MQQLYNSGYQIEQIRDIVESGLKCAIRKEKNIITRENCYRGGEETFVEIERKKLIEPTNWYEEKTNVSDGESDAEADKLK